MGMQEFLLFLTIYSLICGFLAMNIAEHKHQSSGAWFICGFLFGILGLIAAVGLPVKIASESSTANIKKCPHCAELVKPDANICRYCGRDFPVLPLMSTEIQIANVTIPIHKDLDSAKNYLHNYSICPCCKIKFPSAYYLKAFKSNQGVVIICNDCSNRMTETEKILIGSIMNV